MSCYTAGPPGARGCGYDRREPRPADKFLPWKLQDWTLQFVESSAGQALMRTARDVNNMTELLSDYMVRTDRLVAAEQRRAPIVPKETEHLWTTVSRIKPMTNENSISEGSRIQGPRKQEALVNRFIRHPHETATSSGRKWVSERALPIFSLRALGGGDVEVPAVIDHASVKTCASPDIIARLYHSNASISPRKPSRPPLWWFTPYALILV